ncbi:DMT family transporter [Maridesulfovibrio ferrireducens]|uniref:DMT family transporter n=1 Tax=Maridesulfovibrio ferrireducens TaxID=246191 RepID=UPI001A241512|nr:EamA family transporter [Maridesulfovibrio ferrireducens]MBI9112966.1 EamA family transporter [Maridesulfovibrio ferrireducens]
MNLRGCILILIAAVMWSLIGPVSKFPLEQGIPPLENAFWRALFAWILFAVHAYRIRAFKIATKDIPFVVCFGIVGVTVFYGSYQLAVQGVGAALASVLLYTAPAWVAFMSWLFLGEKMGPIKLCALSMTIIGVVCVSLGPQIFGTGKELTFTWFGLMCGLTSGFAYALYFIFGKTFFSRYTTPTIFLYALPIGAAGLLPFFEFHHKTPTSWICIITLAVICTYVSYTLYYAGMRWLEATNAAVIATIEPVMAAILAWWWWDESFDWTGYLGSMLIVSAVLIIIMEGKITSRVLNQQTETI